MQQKDLNTSLTKIALERKVTLFVLFLTVIAVGLISTNRLPVEMQPRGAAGHYMAVNVPWNAGVPEEILEKLGIPLEEELSTVRGIDSITTNAYKNSSRVELRFKQGTDMDVAYREVRDRVERARTRFPEGVDKPRIYKHEVGAEPVVRMTIGYNQDTDHYDLINKHVIMPFMRLDGVADVEFHVDRKSIQIEVDKNRAEAYGINVQRLAGQLRGDNFTLSSGSVVDGGKKYILKSKSTFRRIEDLNHIPINDNIKLSDIAEIKFEPDMDEIYYRHNGMESIGIQVKKEGEANSVEVSARIMDAVDKMKKNPALAGYYIRVYKNEGTEIGSRLNNLANNGIWGAFMAGTVLYFFLRRFRITVIIAMAIPFCLLISLTAMYFTEESLNTVTILGLVICVGLLVDNSVVVAENIHRLHQSGLSRRDACLKGVSQIGLAITTATMTTLIVFLPSILIGGEMRFILYKLALPVVAALTASLITAMVFIPLCVYLTMDKYLDKKNYSVSSWNLSRKIRPMLSIIYENTFGKFSKFYNNVLCYFLNRRIDLAIILSILISVSYFYAYKKLDFSEHKNEEPSDFKISVGFPDNYLVEERSVYMSHIENYVEANKELLGIKSYDVFYTTWTAHFTGHFSSNRNTLLTREEAADQVYENCPEQPGVRVRYKGRGEAPRNDYRSRHYVRLIGDNPEQLREVAEGLKPTFEMLPNVVSILEKNNDDGPSEMSLIVDRDKASSVGVEPRSLANTISSAISGSQLPRFMSEGRQIPIRLQFTEEDKAELDDVKNYLVPASDGKFTSVGAITKVSFQKNEGNYIRRDNKKVSHHFGMKLKAGEESQARRAIEEAKRNIDLPEGVSFSEMKTSFDNSDKENGTFVVIMSIVFIYMLIAFLFESFLMPLSIIMTIPLSAMGAIWIHYLGDVNMDKMGLVGATLLVGIVVNNGIVLVDYANRLRLDGLDRTQSLLKAASHRFRPIVMTAITTICGMIPLTLMSSAEVGIDFQSFGYTLIGGMTSSTLFTLVTVPVFYTLVEDAQTGLKNIFASVYLWETGR